MKSFVSGKIHDCRVTGKSIEYFGSISISAELMRLAGIQPYEQVHVINLNNGQRWITYALPTVDSRFTLNGGGARLGEIGDRCVILSYQTSDRFEGAKAVFCDDQNNPTNVIDYEDIGNW